MKRIILVLTMILTISAATISNEINAGMNSSFYFDGIDDLILVPSDVSINSKSMTIMMDFKVLDSGSLKSGMNKTSQFLLFKKNPEIHFNEGIAIFYDESAKNISAVASNRNRKQVYAYSPKGSIENNTWYSLIVSADSINIRLILDGKEQKSNQTGFSLVFDKEPLLIGGRSNVLLENEKYGGMFAGEMRNIKIFNQSLNEIGDDFLFSDNANDSILILDFSYHESNGIIHDKLSKNNGVMLRGRPSTKEKGTPDYIRIHPNPAKGKTEVRFKLKDDSDLKLIIRDLSGKEVQVLHQGILKKGEHEFNFIADSLSTGYYVCYLESGSSIRTASFIIAK
ncbi:MAG: T9SS type A sorting domain-containing protein [Candidatus Kapabacteria bacterium]|nr:T9SS type A sorting domain-containing protein [Ignavibacteriota bacterium]MCW5883879.1 T9SS type A sorting domain-containing protein [Candidatus Kapabacteria bacterium]